MDRQDQDESARADSVAEPSLRLAASTAISVLIVVVLIALLPVVENGFVNLDDQKNFVENPAFRGLGWRQLAWAWTTRHLGVYQPLSWMILEAEYAAWGIDPRGYHLTSLVLHLLVAIALYALTEALLTRCRHKFPRADAGVVRACAVLTTALFATHPLRVEVVAWVSCQPYLVCALFALLAVLAYLQAHGRAPAVHRGRMVLVFLLFGASLLSKAAAVLLPAVLLTLDVYPLGRLGRGGWLGAGARRVYAEKVPFVALSAIFMVLAVWARPRAIAPLSGHGVESRVAQACYAIWFYLAKTLVPIQISACYPLPVRISLDQARFCVSVLGVLVATAALVTLRRKLPAVLAAWASYLAILAPSSGLLLLGPCIAADRYSFMATMGLFVLAASGLCSLAGGERFPRRVAGGLHVVGWVAVLSLVLLTRAQCRTWRSSEALWSHALAVSPEPNPFASYSLGLLRAHSVNTLAEAQTLIMVAVRLTPDDYKAHNALATVLARRGRLDESLTHFREALRLNVEDSYAWVNMANILAIKGDHARALAAYKKALQIEPDNPQAHSDFGVFLLRQGIPHAAEAHLIEALRINPALVQTRRTLDELRLGQHRDSQINN
jgi:tetratricopeptide (TPR) repeat protein